MLVDFISPVLEKCFSLELKQEGKPSSESHFVTAQDSCDMRDRLLRYFATCGQEKPLSGSLKIG